MKTFKLKHNGINITDWCKNYSYMFRKLYVNFELSQDKNFQKELREKYHLDSWFFQSCLTDVKMKIDQNETQNEKKASKIEELQEILKGEFVGVKQKRNKYNLHRKLNYLLSHKEKGITFGTLALLRRISYLSNIKGLENEKELISLKAEYRQNRILPILSVGEAPQGSNRKFDFDFENKKMVFKPKQGVKYPIEFHCSKKQHLELIKLQKYIGDQAITVRIDNEHVYVTFDNEKLCNYAFNEKECFKELKLIPKDNKKQRTECYKKWIQEKEARMLIGKNPLRYLGLDLNPEYIGFSILEKAGDDFKVIFKNCIDLHKLNTKMGLSSTDKLQVYQNNKRVHEIHEAWKHIFNIAERFKVYNCVVEDLDFKQKGVNENATEANRKTKNLWHRTVTTNAINKYCLETGMKLIKVNPCYSSFIGNIKHKLFDCVSASIEIGRRGITKYLKGGFFPKLERTDLDTMCQLGLDVLSNTISSWKEAYLLFKSSGLRYRWENKPSLGNNLASVKSRVILYNF